MFAALHSHSNSITKSIFALVVALILASALGAAVRADAPSPLAYLPISNGFRVDVLNLQDGTTIGELPMRAGLYYGVAISNNGTRLYVSNEYENSLVVFDTLNWSEITAIALPDHGYVDGCDPSEVVLSPDNTRVYVACGNASSIEIIDTATNTIIDSFGVGYPRGMAISPDGSILYVGSFYNNTLRIVDLTSENLDQRILGVGLPCEVAVSPLGDRVYITHCPYDDITVVDPTGTVNYPNGKIIDTIPMLGAKGFAFNQTGTLMYVGNSPEGYNENGQVTVIDIAADANDVVAQIAVHESPGQLQMDSSYRCLYVHNAGSGTLEAIDLHTNTASHSVQIPGGFMARGDYLNQTPAAQTMQFSNATYHVNDSGGAIQITVTRACHSIGAASVAYATSDGSAVAGTEYQAANGTLNFADGELSKTFTVNILDDGQYHGSLNFNLTLSDPTDAFLGNPSAATVTIDETTPAANLDVSVEVSPDGVATGDEITYCYTIYNTGPDTAMNLNLTTEVGNGTTFASYQIADCGGGGGGGESFNQLKRVNGNAYPTLSPECNTPAVGATGTIVCTWDSLEQYSNVSVEIVLNATATEGEITQSATVASAIADPWSDGNSVESTVNILTSAYYVSENGDCGSFAPCADNVYDALDNLSANGTLTLLGGTYSGFNARQRSVTFAGNITMLGNARNIHHAILQAFVFRFQDGSTLQANQITNNGVIISEPYSQYVSPNSQAYFYDALEQTTVVLIAGDSELGETTLQVNAGATPPTCGTQALPVSTVKRWFNLTPTNHELENGATVRFYFDNSELNSQNPNALVVWHCNGTVWESLGGTADSANHFVEVQNVKAFSPFALGPAAPTSATLVATKAKLHKKGGVVVKWETGMELNVIGFNVYRSAKRDGAYKLVKPEIIAAKSPGEAIGNKYNLRDKHAKSGKTYFYKIEVVKASGDAEWSEPLKVKGK